jgi:hypothetical protein
MVKAPVRVRLRGREMMLMDAFSANDPSSLDRLWSMWRHETGDLSKWPVLLNTRADRPLRTRRFCEWIAGRPDVGQAFVAGSHSPTAVRLLSRRGIHTTRLRSDTLEVASDSGETASDTGDLRVIVGIGNAGGLGQTVRSAAGRGPA